MSVILQRAYPTYAILNSGEENKYMARGNDNQPQRTEEPTSPDENQENV